MWKYWADIIIMRVNAFYKLMKDTFSLSKSENERMILENIMSFHRHDKSFTIKYRLVVDGYYLLKYVLLTRICVNERAAWPEFYLKVHGRRPLLWKRQSSSQCNISEVLCDGERQWPTGWHLALFLPPIEADTIIMPWRIEIFSHTYNQYWIYKHRCKSH